MNTKISKHVSKTNNKLTANTTIITSTTTIIMAANTTTIITLISTPNNKCANNKISSLVSNKTNNIDGSVYGATLRVALRSLTFSFKFHFLSNPKNLIALDLTLAIKRYLFLTFLSSSKKLKISVKISSINN